MKQIYNTMAAFFLAAGTAFAADPIDIANNAKKICKYDGSEYNCKVNFEAITTTSNPEGLWDINVNGVHYNPKLNMVTYDTQSRVYLKPHNPSEFITLDITMSVTDNLNTSLANVPLKGISDNDISTLVETVREVAYKGIIKWILYNPEKWNK